MPQSYHKVDPTAIFLNYCKSVAQGRQNTLTIRHISGEPLLLQAQDADVEVHLITNADTGIFATWRMMYASEDFSIQRYGVAVITGTNVAATDSAGLAIPVS